MKWEYLKEYEMNCQTESRINELGAEGWELVTILGKASQDMNVWYFFKRPLIEVDPHEQEHSECTDTNCPWHGVKK